VGGGAWVGPGRLYLTLICGATPHGAARAFAAPRPVAPHYASRAPPGSMCRRGSPSRATQSGVARMSAAPPWTARQKRVSQMKYFRNKFIFKNCFKFRFVLSKSPILAISTSNILDRGQRQISFLNFLVRTVQRLNLAHIVFALPTLTTRL
jgi:hypothetical protein